MSKQLVLRWRQGEGYRWHSLLSKQMHKYTHVWWLIQLGCLEFNETFGLCLDWLVPRGLVYACRKRWTWKNRGWSFRVIRYPCLCSSLYSKNLSVRWHSWSYDLMLSILSGQDCLLCVSERQEQQVLRAAPTGPSTIRLTWNLIPSARGYRLEWRDARGQTHTHTES